MKVFFVILLIGFALESSAVSQYRGNAREDYQQLVSVLNEMISVGANLFNQIMKTSYKMQKNVEVKMDELVKTFEEASFANGNLIALMMQKWSQDTFSEMLNRMYLPIPLPTINLVQHYDLDSHFNNSICANRKLNAVVMKMWTHLREPQSKAEQFLKNIKSAFQETMDARPELIHAIAKISGKRMPCYKNHNQFLPQDQFLMEVHREIDLYIELLSILDLRNEKNYNPVELEYLKMVARKFVLSASKLVSVLLELFRHTREFQADLSGRFNNDVEIKEQLVLKYPEDLYLLSNLFNDAVVKNKAIINLSLKMMINDWQEQNNSVAPGNSESPNGWTFDRDFDAAITANQQWNALLFYHWKRLRNGQDLPPEILSPLHLRADKRSPGALQDVRDILQVLNQAVDVKVKLITILLEIWTRGRERPVTPVDMNLESHYLNNVISPPKIIDNTLKSESLQNSPGFLSSLGDSDLSGILGGFLLDPQGLLGLDIGVGGLGLGDSGPGLSSILGSGLIDQDLQSTVSKSMNHKPGANQILSKMKLPFPIKTTKKPLNIPESFPKTTVKPFPNKFEPKFVPTTQRPIITTVSPVGFAKLIQNTNNDAIIYPDSPLLNQRPQQQQISNERRQPQSSMKFVSNGNVLMNYMIRNHTNYSQQSQLNDRAQKPTIAPASNKDTFVFPDHPSLQKPAIRQSRFIGQRETGGETGSYYNFDYFGRPYFLSFVSNGPGYNARINYG